MTIVNSRFRPPPIAQLTISICWSSSGLGLSGVGLEPHLADGISAITWRAIWPLCENMTSSTKPEVHKISQRRQSRGPGHGHRPVGNVHKNLVLFGRVVFTLCEWTDRQTNRHTRHNTLHHINISIRIMKLIWGWRVNVRHAFSYVRWSGFHIYNVAGSRTWVTNHKSQ